MIEKFPKKSDAKLNAGIFDGPQIRELISDSNFCEHLQSDEKRAWLAFKTIATNFLGNQRITEYEQAVEEFLNSF